jgi:hypothetical protein
MNTVSVFFPDYAEAVGLMKHAVQQAGRSHSIVPPGPQSETNWISAPDRKAHISGGMLPVRGLK